MSGENFKNGHEIVYDEGKGQWKYTDNGAFICEEIRDCKHCVNKKHAIGNILTDFAISIGVTVDRETFYVEYAKYIEKILEVK